MADRAPDQGADLGSSSLLSLAGAAFSGATTLLLVLLTARVLSPEDAGRVFTTTSVLLIAATVLRAGTPTAVVRFTSRRDDPTDATARAVGRRGIRPVLLAALVGSVVAGLGAAPLADLLGVDVAVVLLLAVSLPAAASLETALAVTRGQHDLRPTVAIDRIGRPALQLALTAAAAVHPTVTTLVAAWCLPYLLALVVAYLATPALRGRAPGHRLGPAEGREFRRFVVARGGAATVQICFARLDIVLVAALAGPAEAAIYTAATRFVTLCQLVQQAIATAGEPALARDLGRQRADLALDDYRTTTGWLVALLWPVLCATAVLAPMWLQVFGPAYTTAVPTVLVLVAAMLVATGVGMVETVVNMAGRAGFLLGTNLAALAVMVVIDLLLVPRLGSFGAALGWSTAIITKNLLALVQVRRTLPGPTLSRGWVLSAGLAVLLTGALPALLGAAAGRPGVLVGLGLGAAALAAAYTTWATELRLDRLFTSRRRRGAARIAGATPC